MAKLIGQITYPQEAAFSVEYVKLYGENDSSLLEFRLINRGKKTVNAYRVDLSYLVDGEEKREAIQGKNLELKNGSTTDVITVTLNGAAEEGTLTLSAVIYDDLSHNPTETSYPFASFDAVSRVAENALSGGTVTTEIVTPAAPAQPAKESLMTIAKGESTAPVPEAPPSPKRSALPLILALSSLGGMILTVILQVLSAYFVYQKIGAGILTLGEASAVISLLFFTLFTGCAALALTAILLHKKNPNQSVAVILLSILSLIAYLYFTLMFRVGIFLLVAIALGIVFFILSLVKKNTALLVTAISMILILFLFIGLFSGCISCKSENQAPPDTLPPPAMGNTSTPHRYLCLKYTSNGDGTCFVSGCSWMSSSEEQPENPHEFAIINDLVNVTIPEYSPEGDRVIAIGSNAFSYDDQIESITFSPSVTAIGSEAFRNCQNLKRVDLCCVQQIQNDAFTSCSALESVSNLSYVTVIDEFAFAWCSSLSAINLGNNLLTLQSGAFHGSGLTSITLPQSIVTMGNEVFKECSSLTSAVFECPLPILPVATFADCIALESVTLPYEMQEIGEYAFQNSGIVSIVLPRTIRQIRGYAFGGCENLKDIYLPSSVTTIIVGAFDCPPLQNVYWEASQEDVESHVTISGGNNSGLWSAYNLYYNCAIPQPEQPEFDH